MIIGLGEGEGVNEKGNCHVILQPIKYASQKAAHRLLFSSPEEANEPFPWGPFTSLAIATCRSPVDGDPSEHRGEEMSVMMDCEQTFNGKEEG
ncbi:hypothetical protein CDAR_533301 [Caerostris darwini]|uniref:Uncharacterized protein n=1 Tax=Caerostris darwini TaxID=1538125 RepID=A0AAV4WXB2_9ARAC|nr:hypothetical protein CDAR_533301 [Caerostris darwini]